LNATERGRVYGVPFQNSMPLLYYSARPFEEPGLDPARPPATWQDWLDAARKLTKSNGKRHGTPRRRWRWSSLTNTVGAGSPPTSRWRCARRWRTRCKRY
ncbi:MAG: extracellular solute-binding protein, partial [Acetobacteraceae bacterium]|nr:extracellular solute-binding protein [Acetobacteraceae bacterium]